MVFLALELACFIRTIQMIIHEEKTESVCMTSDAYKHLFKFEQTITV